jgi:peroxiredoxin
MIKRYGLTGLCFAFSLFASAQITTGKWHAALQRQDGQQIPFELDIQNNSCYILNGTERIKTDIVFRKDSAIISLPVFESLFKVRIVSKDSLNGVWISGGEVKDIIIPFVATAGGSRFQAAASDRNVQGKWKIAFTRANQTKRYAIGNITQQGNKLSGSVLTPAGDYRYLDGIVSGDSMFLSTFDGAHAILLSAKINPDHLAGTFYSGAATRESWTAVMNDDITLTPAVTAVKEGSDGKPDFSFKDLEGNAISLQNERFKGKVVILQLMGSWCPNCMDETAFLSEYYLKNKDRGIEVIALAYELSTDEARSRKSLQKFQTQFNVQYPILNTRVAVSDPQRTEKTLPQLTTIKAFPTTVILDKEGKISEISTTYYGPGAGDYHLKYKAHFEERIHQLLNK